MRRSPEHHRQALVRGPERGGLFKFNESISFQVMCSTQAELDEYWERLSAGGDERAQQCGWLKDRFGVSWQAVPSVLPELLKRGDAKKSDRLMKAVLQMKKLDIAAIERAYEG